MKQLISAIGSACALVVGVWCSSAAVALPFNQDMVGGQLITGKVMRGSAPGSVAAGVRERQFEKREDAHSFENPYAGKDAASHEFKASLERGARLYAQQCKVCHGVYSAGQHTPADLQARWGFPSFNLLLTQPKLDPAKTDGYMFGYIYYGAMAIMPAYGWKLSHSEIWDIVNYVRKLQAEAPQ